VIIGSIAPQKRFRVTVWTQQPPYLQGDSIVLVTGVLVQLPDVLGGRTASSPAHDVASGRLRLVLPRGYAGSQGSSHCPSSPL
jgi:hypothetical protein